MHSTSAQTLRQIVVIVVVLAIWSGLLVGFLALTNPRGESPTPVPASPELAQVTLTGDVLPIFENRCQRCHGPTRADAGLRLDSYESVTAGSSNGPVVAAGSAGTSHLVDLIVSGRMPLGAAKLPDDEIQTIVDWVDAGAPDN